MKATGLFALLVAVSMACAISIAEPFQCRGPKGAEDFVQRFAGILSKRGSDLGDSTAPAEALLADDSQEISNSILSLEGRPV